MPLAKDLRRILTPPVGCNIIGHNNNALTNFRYPGFNFHLAKYMHHLFYCLLAYRPQRQEETSLHAGSAIDTATQYLFCVCVCLFELQFLGQNHFVPSASTPLYWVAQLRAEPFPIHLMIPWPKNESSMLPRFAFSAPLITWSYALLRFGTTSQRYVGLTVH